MVLTVKQHGVLKGIIAGAAITFVVIVGAILFGPNAAIAGSLSRRAPCLCNLGRRLHRALAGDIHRYAGTTPVFHSGGYRRRRTFCWLGNRERSAINTSKHAGTVGCCGVSSSGVGDSNAGILDIGDTSGRLSLRVWSSAICAWLSRWCTVASGRVCSYLLSIRADARTRDSYGRMQSIPLELAAMAANNRMQRTVINRARTCIGRRAAAEPGR